MSSSADIEACLEALSKAQDYHNTGKKVDKVIHDGWDPSVNIKASCTSAIFPLSHFVSFRPSNNLEEYLPAIDSLQEALSYFQENNPEHVEYTHLVREIWVFSIWSLTANCSLMVFIQLFIIHCDNGFQNLLYIKILFMLFFTKDCTACAI